MLDAKHCKLRLGTRSEHIDVGKERGYWTLDNTIRIAKAFPALGTGILDVSSGGSHPTRGIEILESKDDQNRMAGCIRREVKRCEVLLLIGVFGPDRRGRTARKIVSEDLCRDREAAQGRCGLNRATVPPGAAVGVDVT